MKFNFTSDIQAFKEGIANIARSMKFEISDVGTTIEARKIGDKVTITSGPLKTLEGYIVKVDRHNRNGQVAIQFDDRVWKVWLAFEILE